MGCPQGATDETRIASKMERAQAQPNLSGITDGNGGRVEGR